MDAIEQHIHQRVLDTWQNFPWKLDYVFYFLFSQNKEISDVRFQLIGDAYTVTHFRDNSFDLIHVSKDNKTIERDKISIHKDELLNYLNINKPIDDYLVFPYVSILLSDQFSMRGQRNYRPGEDLIIFRLLQQSPNINFSKAINFLEKYVLTNDLKDNLLVNSGFIEKKVKI
jgi:hypothetical protein